MTSESHHPAYFQTRFQVAQFPPQWPRSFAILTAYATTGQQWSPEANAAADQLLEQRLLQLALWHWRITGYSPWDGHAEPGWAVDLPLESARQLGLEFQQDALYWIVDDRLFVTKCSPGNQLVPVDSFQDRLDEIGEVRGGG